jgi:hypothetical protein
MAKSTDKYRLPEKYGIITLKEIVNHLWKNRELLDDPEFCFCDPDYAGLPDRIARKLNEDVVDVIWWIFRPENARQLVRKQSLEKALREALFLLAPGR